ncbi:IS630 family transposase [Uruburuella testudinis]|uniref:IS630 family transposase n=1 Tax=Uruburuella testudinis TaxID=1282863 RepID=A0ABY4DR07_9NEIS|nr:IS630 family transposase [Uruburuella testudinis]UOO81463.1 IS630 family transposase [Uruburuella testudinis]UOO81483.1 IS630 family transposase [Uruburuella testudinis]
MEKEDTRKLSADALYEKRKQVIRLHKMGMGIIKITQAVGMCYEAVRQAITTYQEGGMTALKPKKRGRSPGEYRQLNAEQEAYIQKLIIEQRPEQLKMDFALWTRNAVKELILQELEIDMPVRTVGSYLQRWGFTPQKPIKKAYEQQPEAVKTWLDETYPSIARRAKAENAEIHWGDETALVNTDVRGRSYSPKGKTPVTYAVGGTRHKLSMISTVNNRGKAHWMIIDAAFDADKLIKFMQSLCQEVGRKVFLILDNLRVHHSKKVKAWLAEHCDEIEVFHLPSYSPELNPDERLNADLKQVISAMVPVRTKAKLRSAVVRIMESICSTPKRVMAYFGDSHVRYAGC